MGLPPPPTYMHLQWSYLRCVICSLSCWPGTDLRRQCQVLTGAPPFAGQQGPELACQITLGGKRPPRPNSSESLGITDEVWDLLEMCWTKDASSRPEVNHVVGCLERAAKHRTGGATAPLLVSEPGVEEVMNTEREEAQKIADELDKVRGHAGVQRNYNSNP